MLVNRLHLVMQILCRNDVDDDVLQVVDVELHRNSLGDDFIPFTPSSSSSSSTSSYMTSVPGQTKAQKSQRSGHTRSPLPLSPDPSLEKGSRISSLQIIVYGQSSALIVIFTILTSSVTTTAFLRHPPPCTCRCRSIQLIFHHTSFYDHFY